MERIKESQYRIVDHLSVFGAIQLFFGSSVYRNDVFIAFLEIIFGKKTDIRITCVANSCYSGLGLGGLKVSPVPWKQNGTEVWFGDERTGVTDDWSRA